MQVLNQLTWRQGPVVFDLSSPDESIIRRAAEVLSYWHYPSSETRHQLQMSAAVVEEGFHFSASTGESARYKDLPTLIRAAETQAALFLLDQTDTVLSIHGALLERNGRGIIIVGPSGAGKSTTSCALWAAGWRLLADDVTMIDPASGEATPVLRRVSLRYPSRPLLGDDFWNRMLATTSCDETPEGYIFHPDELEGASRACSVQLSAVIFLGRNGAPQTLNPAELQAVESASALLSLCPYTNVVRKDGMGAALKQLCGIVGRVKFYDMSRGPLETMTATLNNLVGV